MFATKRKPADLPEINFDIPTINVSRPLSEKARKIVEAGFSEFATMKEERDQADGERLKALDLVNQATTSIRSLQQEIDNLKGRCMAYQLERDEAVAKFAKLQALFVSVQAQLKAFEIPEKNNGIDFAGHGGGATSKPEFDFGVNQGGAATKPEYQT